MPARPSSPQRYARDLCLIVSEVIPGVPVLAVVFTHSSPLPFTQIGTPFFPRGFPSAGFIQSALFLCHDPSRAVRPIQDGPFARPRQKPLFSDPTHDRNDTEWTPFIILANCFGLEPTVYFASSRQPTRQPSRQDQGGVNVQTVSPPAVGPLRRVAVDHAMLISA